MNNGIVNIRGKDYKTVALRVSEFRGDYGDSAGIETEICSIDESIVLMKATVRKVDNQAILATGYSEENRAGSSINKTSAVENAETSAIGRALAALGYGGQEYASAEEVLNAAPEPKKPELTKNNAKAWDRAVLAVIRDGDLKNVLKAMDISPENQAALMAEAKTKKAEHEQFKQEMG